MSPIQVLEAVPNFSVGQDAGIVAEIADAARAQGADVLDWSADADHNRAVITWIGPPSIVENAAVAAARVAASRIDLRSHRGLHPRIGALDVMPLVPVAGLTMDEARGSAHRVGERLAREVGLPVFFYADASTPRGRSLAELRRGGFEAMVSSWPAGRVPDELPPDWPHPGAHPTAGAVCVGARPVLLAWNVVTTGIALDAAKTIAASVRAANGGFPGVRALAFLLESSGRVQISMNLEDAERNSPMQVFRRIENAVVEMGGTIMETEIIGMLPDRLLLEAAADRLKIVQPDASRQLTRQVLRHVAETRSPEQSTE